MTTSTDVLVVGAGPTGLTLASDLCRRSVDCRLVDRATTHHTRSRGKGLQPRSLEVFDDLGVAEAALAAGRTHHHVRLYSRGRLALDLDVPARPPQPGVPYPNLVVLPQPACHRGTPARPPRLRVPAQRARVRPPVRSGCVQQHSTRRDGPEQLDQEPAG